MAHKMLLIKASGQLQMLHDDRLSDLYSRGHTKIKRASHVEPGDPTINQQPTKWYADMTPSKGGVLGPFNLRQQALDAEVEWLHNNNLGATT